MALQDDLVTYLSLTPEFGGARFGPFDQAEIRLGSDPERCHIVLPEALGVRPIHLMVVRQAAASLVLTPTERTAGVFLWKPGTRRAQVVLSPTAIQPGDAFALVTEDGPRFVVESVEAPAEVKAKRAAAGGRGKIPTAEALGQEAKRQAFTKLLTTGPAQLASRAWTFIKSGSFLQPRYIFLGLTIAGGYLFGGISTCSLMSTKKSLATTEVRVQSCEQELAFAENVTGDSTEYSFQQLVASITGVYTLGVVLEEDDALRAEVKAKAQVIFNDPSRYDWLISPKDRKSAEFADWRERTMGDKRLDPDTARLVVWLAAQPGRMRTEFLDLTDSEGKDVCGRGPLKLSFRQAHSLGLLSQPDALVDGDPQAIRDDKVERERLLGLTLAAANAPALPQEQFETELDPVRMGRSSCLYVKGDDDRTNTGHLFDMLAEQLGENATQVPPIGSSYAATARIAKLWSSDLTRVDLSHKDAGVDFSQAPVGAVLDGLEARGDWVLSRTAETIAKAVAIPCLAQLTGNPDDVKKILGEDLPSPVNCLVLDWKLRNEK